MKRRLLLSCLIVSMLVTVGWVGTKALAPSSDTYAYRSNNLLRLHVLANSDSPKDQAIKLQVRDAILRETGELFENAKTSEEAQRIATENIDRIVAVANNELDNLGQTYRAKAVVGKFDFPIKRYGDLVLPAGKYNALRVLIGNAGGQNWWCVLFPPLCFKDFNSGFAISKTNRVSAIKSMAKYKKYKYAKGSRVRPGIRFSLRSLEKNSTGEIPAGLVWSKARSFFRGKRL